MTRRRHSVVVVVVVVVADADERKKCRNISKRPERLLSSKHTEERERERGAHTRELAIMATTTRLISLDPHWQEQQH